MAKQSTNSAKGAKRNTGPKTTNPARAEARRDRHNEAASSAASARTARPADNQGSSNPDAVRAGDSGRSASAFESPRIEDRRSEVDPEAADASTNPDPLRTPERSESDKDTDPTGKNTAMGSCNCPPGRDMRP